MTPADFAQKYKSLNVFVLPYEGKTKDPKSDAAAPASWLRGLNVHQYRLGESGFRSLLWGSVSSNMPKTGCEVTVESLDAKPTTVSVDSKKAWELFRFPFVGKGSPEQVQATIQLLYRYRINVSTIRQFAGEGTSSFIGLDCNGFVGNYLQRVVQGQDWLHQKNLKDPGPDSYIADIMKSATDPVTSLSEIADNRQSIYVLAFCSPQGVIYDHGSGPMGVGHIMISNPGVTGVPPNEMRFQVSESTGGIGLTTTEYVIKKELVKGNRLQRIGAVFNVFRGSHKYDMTVKMGRLK